MSTMKPIQATPKLSGNDTLKLLKESPNIKQKDIAIKLKVSEITIKRNIKELKERGYIERIGAKKTGYWKILKDL